MDERFKEYIAKLEHEIALAVGIPKKYIDCSWIPEEWTRPQVTNWLMETNK